MHDLNTEQLRGAVRIYMAAMSLQDAVKELGPALEGEKRTSRCKGPQTS